jgi:hypothetical protein
MKLFLAKVLDHQSTPFLLALVGWLAWFAGEPYGDWLSKVTVATVAAFVSGFVLLPVCGVLVLVLRGDTPRH